MKLRQAALHPSLMRPLLLGGGERKLVLLNGLLIVLLIMGFGLSLATVGLSIVLATVGQWALIQAAKANPRMSEVYRRHIRYQTYYASKSPLKARSAWVYPSVPTLINY